MPRTEIINFSEIALYRDIINKDYLWFIKCKVNMKMLEELLSNQFLFFTQHSLADLSIFLPFKLYIYYF